MLRRFVSLGLLLVTVLLVQVSVLPLAVRGAFVPDLVVVLVALVALERGPRSGLWLAASCSSICWPTVSLSARA